MQAGNSEHHYIGMISGTSRDGVDAALVNFHGNRVELLHAICVPYPSALRNDVDAMILQGQKPAPGKAAALDEMLGRFFAKVANDLMRQAGVERQDVTAIGSHGQTVWHEPDADLPISIQLGSGSMISRATGVTTVTDFRRADLVAGGQGAPLAPLLHRVLLSTDSDTRAIVNIGGIANVTVLRGGEVTSGFDSGPGNCLMDAWIQEQREEPYDANGDWAAGGEIEHGLLQTMMKEPYFEIAAPKSTGLELFNKAWLDRHLEGLKVSAEDIQATLAELTAHTISDAVVSAQAEQVLVCGGGVHNQHLMDRIAARMPGLRVESTQLYGVDPDWVEAILFAWLARERLAGRAQDTRPITGAHKPVLLGKVFEAATRDQ